MKHRLHHHQMLIKFKLLIGLKSIFGIDTIITQLGL